MENLRGRAFNIKTGLAVLATAIATTAVAFTDVNSLLYSTDVLSLPEHAPFDGTVYPVAKVPDWVHLDAAKWKDLYINLSESELVSSPYYDPNQLSVSTDSLTWGNPVDDAIRNAKITYSTPYLGNYKLDGMENGGSHPAVDIKVPEGTPVNSIANGTVIKASNQSSGFGYHVVVQHNNFPTLEDPNARAVLYSSYSHLSEILVSVGDVVTRGQQIALSGSSGTATTPHVHFQIDNEQAPWHPFWPFTWQEASDAGLDFFSAVNEGLGRESAAITTVNPMKYVQAYMTTSGTINPPIVTDTGTSTDAVSYVDDGTVVVGETDVVDNPEVKNDGSSATGTDVTESVEFTDTARFSDVGESSQYYEAIKFLSEKEIINGYDDGTFKPDQPVNRVEALKFILKGISAAIETGNLPFTDVSLSEWYSGFLFTAYKREIVNGNPDGTFRPTDTVNKAEFFKILLNGLNVDIAPSVDAAPYADVLVSDWFAPYIAYAKEIKIIDPNVSNIDPSRGMTRGEVAEAMYKLMKLVE